jgi:hypothetical protein
MCTIDFRIGIVAFSFQGVVAADSVPRRRAWPLPAAAGVPVAGAAGLLVSSPLYATLSTVRHLAESHVYTSTSTRVTSTSTRVVEFTHQSGALVQSMFDKLLPSSFVNLDVSSMAIIYLINIQLSLPPIFILQSAYV